MDKKSQTRMKTRIGWREMNLRRTLNEKEYQIEEIKPPLEPWKATTLKFDAVALSKPKEQYTKEELKALTEQKLSTVEAEIFIWTDGSTSSSQERGGAGVYVQDRI